MQTSGVANWQNPEAQLDYLTKVAPALYAAIGESKVSEMALFGKRLAAQTAAEINAYREKLNMQQPNPNGGNGGSIIFKELYPPTLKCCCAAPPVFAFI